jgi:hypothetical protein
MGNKDYLFYYLNDLWLLTGSTQDYVTRAAGNWGDPATWENNRVPPFFANVTVRNQVTVNVEASCNSLKIESPGSLTVNPSIQLSILKPPDPL